MNITELKALAEKATQGDMQATGNGVHKGIRCVLTTHMEPFEQRMDDAAYYAAANPAAILELIAQLEDAQGEIRALRATEAGLRDRLAATTPLLARIAELDRSLDVMAKNTEAQAHASVMREIELTEKVEKLTRQLEEARKDAERWRWIWNHAHNVSFTYQVDPITSATVMRLHCGSLADVVDKAIRAAIKEQT